MSKKPNKSTNDKQRMQNQKSAPELGRAPPRKRIYRDWETINEIQDRIHDLETELAVTKGWAYNALERYHKEKKDWGEADYGETSAAYSAVAELENQIKSLKWVIEG